MTIIDRILKTKRYNDDEERRADTIRRGIIVERAENGEFYKLVHDEIARLHAFYLQKSIANDGSHHGALALIDLTKRIADCKEAKDRILQQEKRHNERRFANSPELQEQVTHGEPQTI